jgi:hypothetical protein
MSKTLTRERRFMAQAPDKAGLATDAQFHAWRAHAVPDFWIALKRVGRSGLVRGVHARRTVLVLMVVGACLAGWLAVTQNGQARVTTSYGFTGKPETYVVPSGVCWLRIEAIGAAGGEQATAGTPGAGAWAIATLDVTPGEALFVYVGGQGGAADGSTPGAGGWNGGGAGGSAEKAGAGGGGASDVRRGGRTLADRVLIAAGGAGSAGGGIRGPMGMVGGDAGDLTGEDGLAVLGSVNPAAGGGGGSQTAGGRPAADATGGRFGVGGNGASGGLSGGGGGGGGLYGGGGGGAANSPLGGGEGGGGSGYGPPGTRSRTGVWGGYGNGRVAISFYPGADDCAT